ncbi:MAG: hypothetical protein Q9221_002156 [Calogaya cf. arnoldii]
MEGVELFIPGSQKYSTSTKLTSTELKRLLVPLMERFKIINFETRILNAKGDATLTTHNRTYALDLLAQYKKLQHLPWTILNGQQLFIKMSNYDPNEILVRGLKREEKTMINSGRGTVTTLALSINRKERECKVSEFSCGKWEYVGPQVCYHPYSGMSFDGTITFGDHNFILEWEDEALVGDRDSIDGSSASSSDNCLRFQFPYSAIESTILDDQNSYALICTLNQAPKILIGGILAFEPDHFTCCQDYRFELQDMHDVQRVLSLDLGAFVPQSSLQPVRIFPCAVPVKEQLAHLEAALQQPRFNFSFAVKFQLTKLAQNGFLPPRSVLRLVDHVCMMQCEYGATRTAAALRRLCQQIPYAGPLIEASELDPLAVSTLLIRYVEDLAEEQLNLNHTADGMVTYKVNITPSTLRLAGPELESSNRVLRK